MPTLQTSNLQSCSRPTYCRVPCQLHFYWCSLLLFFPPLSLSLSVSFFFLSSSPFNTSLIFCGKFGSPYLGKATAAARAALPISTSVCSVFRVSKQWNGCQCLGFLTCAQMLMQAIALGGLYGHRKRVCTGKLTLSGRKIPCRAPGTRTRVSIAPGFSARRSAN